MDKNTKLVILYDYYGELLTEKQKKYFEDYYFNNLSLKEISENESISRNAVHKQIKDTVEKLNNYEDKLRLLEKNKKIEKLLENIENEDVKKKIIELL